MKIFVCTILLTGLLAVGVASCSMLSKTSGEIERERRLLSEKEIYYVDNINTTDLVVASVGESDFRMMPILFRCSSDMYSQKIDHSIQIHVKCDDFEQILYSVYSKSSKVINPNILGSYEDYSFSINNKQDKIEYVYDIKTSMDVFREIKKIVKKDTNASNSVENFLIRINKDNGKE